MPSILPEYVVLRNKYNGKYLEYVKEEGPVHGQLRFTGEDVASPLAKFQVQSEGGLVHLLSCYSNRYLAASSQASRWIVAEAEEPEKDLLKWSCTFFQPIRLTGDGDDYLFKHVNSGLYAVLMRMGNADPKNNCLFPLSPAPDRDLCDVCTVINWRSLVILPQYVSFKGDNDNYLSARVIERRNYLQFAIPDSGHQTVGHEVFRNLDGSIRLKSNHFGLFWRRSPNWIWADSNDTSTNNRDTLFWPIKLDDNTIALRNLGNDRFCKRLTTEGKTSCLNAASPTIDLHARLHVTELVLSRDIYNVEFHLDRARKYNEHVVMMGGGSAANTTNTEGSLDVRVERTESRTTNWSASVSLTLGVKTTFVTKVPFIAEGKIEVSTEVTSSYEWGREETVTNTIEIIYRALAPPMTRVTVSAIGTTATCNIPFSYTQTDTCVDGRKRTFRMDDGLYTGISSFNVHYQVNNEDIVVSNKQIE